MMYPVGMSVKPCYYCKPDGTCAKDYLHEDATLDFVPNHPQSSRYVGDDDGMELYAPSSEEVSEVRPTLEDVWESMPVPPRLGSIQQPPSSGELEESLSRCEGLIKDALSELRKIRARWPSGSHPE